MSAPKKIEDVNFKTFAENNFPEWGTFLNEQIADKQVPEKVLQCGG